MTCLQCNKALNLGATDKVPPRCPHCQGQAGYQVLKYSQTNPAIDANHQSELTTSNAGQGNRRWYYTGGMCFANTLLWMAFRKRHGTKDLEMFQREYVGDKQKQANVYQKLVDYMDRQSAYQDKYFSSFDHYVNFDVICGTNANALAPARLTPLFGLACGACKRTTPPQAPQANTMIAKICSGCRGQGKILAFVKCPTCQNQVQIDAPGVVKACSCGMLIVLEPTILCRDIRGQANHEVAHRKKASVYRKLAQLENLAPLSYKNGFCFDQNIRLLVDEMFAMANAQPTGYLGVLGFEGDIGHAHVTAFWIRKGWVAFFDPNFGEFLFPDRQAFSAWLALHLSTDHWPGDPVKYANMHDGWYVGLFS